MIGIMRRVVPAVMACVVVVPCTVSAQSPALLPIGIRLPAGPFNSSLPALARLRDAADRPAPVAASQSQPAPKPKGMSPTAIGALIGAGAAAGFTALAAARYGENEGGEFCGRCCLEWSAVSMPVGAAIGAAIGWGIGRASRPVTAIPVVSRKGAGVVVSARF